MSALSTVVLCLCVPAALVLVAIVAVAFFDRPLERRNGRKWPQPGAWYAQYALDAIANGRQPGHFVLDKNGKEVWVSLDPEWDRPFGLTS